METYTAPGKSGIQEHLRVLQFTRLPSMDALQARFNKLLKMYHPDRNRRRPDWAHEKTMRLIDSWRALRRAIQQENKARTTTPEEVSSAAAGQSEESSADKNGGAGAQEEHRHTYQLLEKGNAGYALPLAHIESILSARTAHISRSIFGYVCNHQNRMFTLISPEGERAKPEEAEYIVLFKGGRENYAISVGAGISFGRIEKFLPQEGVVQGAKNNLGAGRLLQREKLYIYPEFLMRACAT